MLSGGSGSPSLFQCCSPRKDLQREASQKDGDEIEGNYLAPPQYLRRRHGLSAEAAGAYHKMFQAYVPPSSQKLPEEKKLILSVLQGFAVLQNIPGAGLANLADALTIVYFTKGVKIFNKGEWGKSAFIVISGNCTAYSDPQSKVALRTYESGSLFGEETLLWGVRRTSTVLADSEVCCGKLTRDIFLNLVTRWEMEKNSRKQSMMRKVRVLDALNDEMICKVVDVLERHVFQEGEFLLDPSKERSDLLIIWEGQAIEFVYNSNGEQEAIDVYGPGSCLAEFSFLSSEVPDSTVKAVTKVKVLTLTCQQFSRMFGTFSELVEKRQANDPRTLIATYFKYGERKESMGIHTSQIVRPNTEWFIVFRPTSRDAIAKMTEGIAVGKGLNVKGKSAKKNFLSGFVPFLQISRNEHKAEIEEAVSHARMMIFYKSKWARCLARQAMETFLDVEAGLTAIQTRAIYDVDTFQDVFGLDIPEAIVMHVYITLPDISFRIGWDTGRPSVPAYMDMNLYAVREDSRPKVVLYQFDQLDPMNPHGLLVAYAEDKVKPVVSDFDIFTVGSKKVAYDVMDPDQQRLGIWLLENTEEILSWPVTGLSWNMRWLRVLKNSCFNVKSILPEMPEYGFGDRTSNSLVTEIVHLTSKSGAVRHGYECFNLVFPQELDPEYLVVWDGFPDNSRTNVSWQYLDSDQVREFLYDRACDGYQFPLNPVWPVRDPGWYDIYLKLKNGPDAKSTFYSWFPQGSGICEKIEKIHSAYPECLIDRRRTSSNANGLNRSKRSQRKASRNTRTIRIGK